MRRNQSAPSVFARRGHIDISSLRVCRTASGCHLIGCATGPSGLCELCPGAAATVDVHSADSRHFPASTGLTVPCSLTARSKAHGSREIHSGLPPGIATMATTSTRCPLPHRSHPQWRELAQKTPKCHDRQLCKSSASTNPWGRILGYSWIHTKAVTRPKRPQSSLEVFCFHSLSETARPHPAAPGTGRSRSTPAR